MQNNANKAQEFKVIILDEIGVIAEPINDATKIYFLFSISNKTIVWGNYHFFFLLQRTAFLQRLLLEHI